MAGVIRMLLALACLSGCVSVPQRFTVRAPDRTPLAHVNLKAAEITLTPQGIALLAVPRVR